MKVAIIGAGATGLSAAYDLSSWGHEVTLYERENFIGGHASTFDVAGVPVERGYHHWFKSDKHILELCEEIGLASRVKWFPSSVGTLYEGHIYNFGTPLDLLKYKPLSAANRIRLGLSALKIQKIKNWRTLENWTATEWLQKHLGQKVYEAFWEPMLRGKFGKEYYREIGMAWVWGKMTTRFASRKGIGKEMLGYPIGSFSEVFDVLARKIIMQGVHINLSTSISKIRPTENRKIDVFVNGKKDPVKFNAVIATTPSHVFNDITEGLEPEYRKKLTGAEYMSAVLLILVLDRPLSHVYWLNVADRSVPFVGVIEHTNLVNSSHYQHNHIVYLSNYLTRTSKYYGMNRNELLEAYIPHLAKINPEFDKSWIRESHHHIIDGAQPIIGSNYSLKMPSHNTGIPNLYLANTTQIYPEDRGTNYSVMMGRNIARTLHDNL